MPTIIHKSDWQWAGVLLWYIDFFAIKTPSAFKIFFLTKPQLILQSQDKSDLGKEATIQLTISSPYSSPFILNLTTIFVGFNSTEIIFPSK